MGVIINIFNLGDAWGKLFANYWLHRSTQLSDRPCGNWLSLLWYIFGARQPLGQDFMIQFFSSCTLQHDSTQMNGSVSWNRILVFAFLNFRISTITGLEQLTELKVLNLAGNLIRKVTGVQNLGCVEELNLRCGWKHNHRKINWKMSRRNRIRTTEGLQSVPSLQKLYMANNLSSWSSFSSPWWSPWWSPWSLKVHVKQWDPRVGFPRQAWKPRPVANPADGGEPGVLEFTTWDIMMILMTRCGATLTTAPTSCPASRLSPPSTSRMSPRRWRAAPKGDF